MRPLSRARRGAASIAISCALPLSIAPIGVISAQGRSELGVVFDASPAFRDVSLLRVDVGGPPPLHRLGGRDFGATGDGPPHSALLEVPGQGALPVSVSLVAGSDTLSTTQVVIDVQPDTRYTLVIATGRRRPPGYCGGAVTAAPLRRPRAGTSSADSVFVSFAGLPRGATCRRESGNQ